ncbi:UNVERIFIED_CONTAM: hypothetical protein O8I53_13070 [Campylobacter lari]
MPTEKLTDANAIKDSYLTIKTILDFNLTSNSAKEHASKYIIDDSKPMYFSQDKTNPNLLTVNYFIKKYISNAKLSDKENEELTQSILIPIEKMQTYTFNTYYYELKKLAEDVKIGIQDGINIAKITPSVNSPLFITSSTSDSNYLNTANGYYKEFNLYYDNDNKSKVNEFYANYDLRYYKRTSTDI